VPDRIVAIGTAAGNFSDTVPIPTFRDGCHSADVHRRERRFTHLAMTDTADNANVIVRPPIAWALAALAAFALQWLMPLRFMPAAVPAGWVGGAVFVMALALAVWAIATMTRAGSNVPTNTPTTTIVAAGPYRFTRNPIYLGMFVGLVGLAIAFDSLWPLVTLVPFGLVIRYGVVAREEAYLERKFGDVYRGYRSRVRRWL
jgi:protein-S-isoprenylcysteine O-methyltransferase Ste14